MVGEGVSPRPGSAGVQFAFACTSKHYGRVGTRAVSELGAYLREQRHQAKLSLRQLAAEAGVSNPYLSQIERGIRKPSAEVLQQLARGLRISAEALYERAGLLEPDATRSGVREAVLADPDLDDRQRRVLLEVYETFKAAHPRPHTDASPRRGHSAPDEGEHQ